MDLYSISNGFIKRAHTPLSADKSLATELTEQMELLRTFRLSRSSTKFTFFPSETDEKNIGGCSGTDCTEQTESLRGFEHIESFRGFTFFPLESSGKKALIALSTELTEQIELRRESRPATKSAILPLGSDEKICGEIQSEIR